MKHILITGASGMLGLYLCRYFSKLGKYKVTATSRSYNSHILSDEFISGDLTEQNTLKDLSNFDFDIVIHCAALTNIEKCESEHDLAQSIHQTATESLAKLFPESIFVYISTDSIFDGITGGYTEADEPNPLNYYAYSKLEGEKAVSRIIDSHYILRTNIYGFHRPLRFSLFEWVYEHLAKGISIGGFTDVFFNPLYIGQLAEVINQLIEIGPEYGTYNAAINEYISKYEFLQHCAAKFGFPPEMVLKAKLPTDSSVAPRPRRSFLVNDKIQNSLKSIDLSLNSGISMLYKDFLRYQGQVENSE